jgi:hypothetical protein
VAISNIRNSSWEEWLLWSDKLTIYVSSIIFPCSVAQSGTVFIMSNEGRQKRLQHLKGSNSG